MMFPIAGRVQKGPTAGALTLPKGFVRCSILGLLSNLLQQMLALIGIKKLGEWQLKPDVAGKLVTSCFAAEIFACKQVLAQRFFSVGGAAQG
jgi:hypothetical protein